MFIIHGAYHFWPKKDAFRNDYCLSCQAPCRSVAVRTFDVGHIFWIPILPVGYWRHWKCCVCGRDPHLSRKTPRPFLWSGLLCLVAVSVILWAMPVNRGFGVEGWFFRIAAPSAAVFIFIYFLRAQTAPSLRERLAAIPPAADVVCPFCSTPLVSGTGTRWSCPGCNAVRY